MTAAVDERTTTAEVRVRQWWRRRVTLVTLAVVIVAAVASWAFTRGPASALSGTPITHGSGFRTIQCDDDVETTEVPDTFGGGGTILGYQQGARCGMLFTVLNPSATDVTVEAIERTPPEMVAGFQVTDATRSRASLRELKCFGCEESQEPFTPFVMAPGEEWTIGIGGVMDGCTPPEGGDLMDRGHTVFRSIDVTVRTMGIRRVVPIALEGPYAVAVEECRG